MLNGIWGRKIGMTQVFSKENMVVPVTAIDFSNWYVTALKNSERDGYDAVQVGLVRKKYQDKPFSPEWLKDSKVYFAILREIKLQSLPEKPFEIGQKIDDFVLETLVAGNSVHAFGVTKGYGFQGVIKRHSFTGGRASHGPRFGRWPGSMSFMRSQGKVIKGKKLPGHMGVEQRVARNLEIIRIEQEAKIALIKGSVPGGSGSLIFMQKV